MVINQRTAAYDIYLEAHSAYTGMSPSEARAQLSQEQFEDRVRQLHQRYMNEEFSMGKLADLLQVPALNLFDILNELELPTYR